MAVCPQPSAASGPPSIARLFGPLHKELRFSENPVLRFRSGPKPHMTANRRSIRGAALRGRAALRIGFRNARIPATGGRTRPIVPDRGFPAMNAFPTIDDTDLRRGTLSKCSAVAGRIRLIAAITATRRQTRFSSSSGSSLHMGILSEFRGFARARVAGKAIATTPDTPRASQHPGQAVGRQWAHPDAGVVFHPAAAERRIPRANPGFRRAPTAPQSNEHTAKASGVCGIADSRRNPGFPCGFDPVSGSFSRMIRGIAIRACRIHVSADLSAVFSCKVFYQRDFGVVVQPESNQGGFRCGSKRNPRSRSFER